MLSRKLRTKIEASVRNCNNFSSENAYDQHIGFFDDDVYFYTIEGSRRQAYVSANLRSDATPPGL